MELKPAAQQEWIRLVRRVRFTERDTLLFALLMASYADPDGSRVFPRGRRLMNVTARSRSTVARCTAELRGKGLLEKIADGSRKGTRDASSEYQLTYPADIIGRLEMLDPDEGCGRELSTTRAHP